ncbi:MAG TPA: MerR family transcriptional regulator, partial [Rectinemataceae bacterium]|nr:MerR family transcriptional regulator [Rectinemataceae bacterium]
MKEAAALAGVSVRTLHHYDALGLLVPESRTAAGYRLYGEASLVRLQQILFFRELDMSLEEIRELLDAPGFDPIRALGEHRRLLALRAERLARLMQTVD